MADHSTIEWTDATWNPVTGCSVVSPGCTNCYAMKMAARLEAMGQPRYAGLTKPSKAGPVWTGELRLVEDALTIPLRRRKPTTYFVNSMSDLFHENVPDAWIDRVFAVMAASWRHTFQLLTKRSARARAYLTADDVVPRIVAALRSLSESLGPGDSLRDWRGGAGWDAYAAAENLTLGNERSSWPLWPLQNLWLGVSAEDQRRADERVPDLLATPAAVRFVSAEPLLGPIDFTTINRPSPLGSISALPCGEDGQGASLDWIIVGGESGPKARAMQPTWAREIRDQCDAAGVAFFFKQWGAWQPREWCRDGGTHAMRASGGQISFQQIQSHPNSMERVGAGPDWQAFALVGSKAAGRLLDGRTHDGFPSRPQLLPVGAIQ